MARFWRRRRAIAAAFAALAGLVLTPAFAEDQGPNAGTDLYDRPVLAVDPGMLRGPSGRNRSMPTGDTPSPAAPTARSGSGRSRTASYCARSFSGRARPRRRNLRRGDQPRRVDDRGRRLDRDALRAKVRSICSIASSAPSSGGSAAYPMSSISSVLARRPLPRGDAWRPNGLRVFDRDRDWSEAFRDDSYGDHSYGAAFAPDGRLATTSLTGKFVSTPTTRTASPELSPARPPSRRRREDPYRLAFTPDGKRLAVGYADVAAVDVLDGRH